MADTREIGMRTGAAMNQAVQMTVAGLNGYGQDVTAIQNLAADLASAAGDLQEALASGVGASPVPVQQAAPQNVVPFPTQEAAQTAVEQAFPGTTAVAAPEPQGLEIIGQQGPAPAWLLVEAAKVGCTKVYDNRADLAENPRRPWFKAADDTVFQSGRNAGKPVAFWPPRD